MDLEATVKKMQLEIEVLKKDNIELKTKLENHDKQIKRLLRNIRSIVDFIGKIFSKFKKTLESFGDLQRKLKDN